ncbi:MAG: SGNH/GDSL hydrolase family protein [Candidatus Curtissbacteria bacterium]|nr:SGNH/GDSL hydrolase family protein [Candidatus Curtissbacteria bacterium]
MKPIVLKAALVSVSILFAILLFELFLRLFVPKPENLAKLQSSSAFLYENKPSADFRYNSLEFDNNIHINADGFRDNEFSLKKDEGEFRIAVLGDSQEEALQVALSDTWQKVMAAKLSSDLGKKIETFNFGISGYGTDQQWLTLTQKIWKFSPDMILLAFSPNDVGDTYKNKLVFVNDDKIEVVSAKERAGGNFLGKAVRETYIYHMVIKASAGNAYLKRLVDKVRVKILGFPKEDRLFLSDAQLIQGPFEVFASQKNLPPEVDQTWNVIRALLFDIEKQAKEHNAEFLVTVNIPRAQVDPASWEYVRNQYHLDENTSSPYQINEKMGEITGELGIDFYDPRLEGIDWYKKNGILHWPGDAHFNINGNLFMGTKVAEYIEKKSLLGSF